MINKLEGLFSSAFCCTFSTIVDTVVNTSQEQSFVLSPWSLKILVVIQFLSFVGKLFSNQLFIPLHFRQ